MIVVRAFCTVHTMRLIAVLTLLFAVGCSQGRYVPMQDKNGEPLILDTHTGKVRPAYQNKAL